MTPDTDEPNADVSSDADEDPTTVEEAVGPVDGPKGREVVVPMRLYKAVTVFSTLFAMVGVVAGFYLLDTATNRAQAQLSEVNVGLAVAGLGVIVLSALVYAYSTRFRADGMGRSKAGTDQADDNG